MLTAPQQNQSIRLMALAIAGLGFVILLFLHVFFKDPKMDLGAILGTLLAVANYVLLAKIVVKVVSKDYKSPVVLTLMFLLKLAVLAVVLLLAFAVFKVNLVGFVLGFGALIPVVVVAGVFFKSTS